MYFTTTKEHYMKFLSALMFLILASPSVLAHDGTTRRDSVYNKEPAYRHYSKKIKKDMRITDGIIAYNLGRANKAEIIVTDAIACRLKNKELKNYANMVIKAHKENQELRDRVIMQEGIFTIRK